MGLSQQKLSELMDIIVLSGVDEIETLAMAITEEEYKDISDEQILSILDWCGEDETITVKYIREY